MRLTRTDWIFIFSSFFVLSLVIVGIGIWRSQSSKEMEEKIQKVDQLSQTISNLVSQPLSVEETITETGITGDLPFTPCYFPFIDNPEYWVNFPREIEASSPIVRYTKAFPTAEKCVHTKVVFDLRKNESTINQGFNKRVDEIIKMFLEKEFEGIEVEVGQIFKNLWYEKFRPKTIWYLSLYVVYKKVSDGTYNTFVGTFEVTSAGILKRSSSFNPQLNTVSHVPFSQMVHKGSTRLASSGQRVFQMLFISARSTATNTLQIYAEPKFQKLISSLDLGTTNSTFKNLIIAPINANSEPKRNFYLNVTGNGKVIIEEFHSIHLPVGNASLVKRDYKPNIFKILTFEPEVILKDSMIGPEFRADISVGILSNLVNSNYYNGTHPVFTSIFNTYMRQINEGELSGAYICLPLTPMNSVYDKFVIENWYRSSYRKLPQGVIKVNNVEKKIYKYYTEVILGNAFTTVTLWDTGNMINLSGEMPKFNRS